MEADKNVQCFKSRARLDGPTAAQQEPRRTPTDRHIQIGSSRQSKQIQTHTDRQQLPIKTFPYVVFTWEGDFHL